MDNVKKLININLLNILSKIHKKNDILLNNNINNYINNNLITLIQEDNNNNIKNILFYLLNNDGNFLLINKNLKNIKDFIIKKYKLETTEEEINNIIIEYLEKRI